MELAFQFFNLGDEAIQVFCYQPDRHVAFSQAKRVLDRRYNSKEARTHDEKNYSPDYQQGHRISWRAGGVGSYERLLSFGKNSPEATTVCTLA